ncbi:MAG: acyltransferase [Myxococcales bacterium]
MYGQTSNPASSEVELPADSQGTDSHLRMPSSGARGTPRAKTATPGHKHVPALDGIRGLAIGLVLLLHFVGNTQAYTSFERVLVKGANYGTYGVALFFVLSGYLITGILIDAKGQPGYFRNFYARRSLRIFPLYYGVLVVGLWLWPAAWAPPELAVSRERQAWLWGYVANFLVAKEQRWDALPYFNHFWSLAVEEHFYFLWPLLVARSSARGLLWWAGGLSLLALVLRVVLAADGAHELVTYTITPTRMDGLCLGGLLAAWARRPNGLDQLKRWAPWVFAGSILYSVLGYVLVHRFAPDLHRVYFEVRETFVLLLFACLLVWVVTSPTESPLARFFTSSPMITLGKYSYGLYVFHAMISWYFARQRTEDWVAAQVGSHTLAVFIQATVGVAASFAIALLSFHFIEKRFLSLKSRFEAKPHSARA